MRSDEKNRSRLPLPVPHPSLIIPLCLMNIVILAAGQGKRMHSSLPKVLHPLAGKALVSHVIDTARCLNPQKLCLVYGHGGDVVRRALDACGASVELLVAPRDELSPAYETEGALCRR